ncbi:Peptidase, M23/M37 family [hydrothermal vent metagenome]|uniref:Peptidase, M23/M37 family n=1 Tax=hydrothermal vent metagenome TaxID=652676 RepID=A0A3B0Y370_9ZZZZ
MNYNNFINKDFRNRTYIAERPRHPALRWVLFAASCAVIGVVIASTAINDTRSDIPLVVPASEINAEPDVAQQQPISTTNNIQLKLPAPSSSQADLIFDTLGDNSAVETADEQAVTDIDDPAWQTLKVKSGDSMSALFDKAKIKPDQLHALMQLGEDTAHLRRIHPGDTIKVISNDEGMLIALNYPIDTIRYLHVERIDDQFIANIHEHEIEIRTAYASGEIKHSLFLSSEKAGLSQNMTMELANIFGWDIDFALDIRNGDQFTVIYEQRFKNGKKIKGGNILAAEFINQGKTHRALRYTDPVTRRAGYYSPDGHSLRKAFLRSPVNFSRISSRFTTKRYHPILHKIRSHKGVDYAAGRGTPVRASGDGKVIFKGRKGGYGRAIILRHGNKYTTLYAHLNSYNRKIRNGRRVTQGQIIGYVGSSGLASGPHLHYEFRVNGVHRNPLTVKFPGTKPIAKRYRDSFKLSTQGFTAQLDVLSRNTLALNDPQ